MLHHESMGGILRFFAPGKSFANRDPYKAVMFLHRIGHVAVLCGAEGALERRDLRELRAFLIGEGFREVYAERAEGHSLPWGELVTEGPFKGYYRVTA